MLLGENRRRRQHQYLFARLDHAHGRTQRDLSLAKADVAADQAIHWTILREIVHHLFNRASLVVRLAVREALLDALQELARFAVRDAWHGLALRVQDQQLAGHLTHSRARTRLELQPRFATKLGERWLAPIGTDVTRQLADLLVGQVEPVFAAEGKIEVVACDAADGAGLEALKTPNAVVFVDDNVAGAQIAERRNCSAPPRRRSAS